MLGVVAVGPSVIISTLSSCGDCDGCEATCMDNCEASCSGSCDGSSASYSCTGCSSGCSSTCEGACSNVCTSSSANNTGGGGLKLGTFRVQAFYGIPLTKVEGGEKNGFWGITLGFEM